MPRLKQLLDDIGRRDQDEALVWQEQVYKYADLNRKRLDWLGIMETRGVKPGDVVGLRAESSMPAVSLLLALLSNANIAVLLPPRMSREDQLLRDACAVSVFRLETTGVWEFEPLSPPGRHPLMASMRESNSSGFVIFTSGSTGRPKAVLHDTERFLAKFAQARKRLRTLLLLQLDHIAGLDTLFYTLCSGGVLIMPQGRDVNSICRLIQSSRAEVLPASPTFLNLLCVSGEHRHNDLSSLRIITYGSEPMSAAVLTRVRQAFPHCKLIQKYGASEFGSPRSKSKGNESLWMKMDSEDCQVKVIDGILWIKSESAMLGYLNAPNAFTEDGWVCTGDEVLVDGPWMHVVGRRSEIIIVGGDKVYPAEVEGVLLELDWIADAVVYGEANPLTGQIVCACIQTTDSISDTREKTKLIRKHCGARLERYKIPVRIEFTSQSLATSRQKKSRTADAGFLEG